IVLQTKDGWYVYRFRNIEYVTPTQVDVLNPIPQSDSTEITQSYITLTACSPMYSAAERIVAYGVFESFTPTSAGEPAALTEGVED
ncbi:MAG: sortase, partial [Microbacterium sp.]